MANHDDQEGNETPIGRLIERLIRRERIANSLSEESRSREVELFREIEALIRRIDPTAVGHTRYRRGRTQRLLGELDRLLREHEPEAFEWMKDRLSTIGRAEAVAAETELVASLGAVGEEAVRRTPITQARLRAIMNTDPFEGRTLREHVRRHSANTLDRVRRQVRLGMVAEESIDDIVRRVRGRQAGFIRRDPKTGAFVSKGTRGAVVRPRFTGGVLSTTTREAESLVRTAVTFVSNEGMLGTFRENAQVLKGVQFLSAGDDRVTIVCASLDGTVWPVDSPDIERPPLHWNCRSALLPSLDYEGLGLEEPPEPDRVFRDMSTVDDEQLRRKISARRRGPRGETLGEVTKRPANITMHDWIRDQRPAVQNRILGRERADLFREGKITSLKDLLRGDNSLIPLDELLRN